MLKKIDWRISFLTLGICWLALEIALRLASPVIWDKLTHSEPLTAALLKDHLSALSPSRRQDKRLCVVLGDSVFYGSALREKSVPNWSQKTPPAYLRQSLGPEWLVLDLSADGLNPLDMAALLSATASLKPDALVIELNLRMLSVADGKAPGCMSRPWLASWLPAELKAASLGSGQANTEKKLFAKIEETLGGGSAIFRYATLARAILFEPSMKALAAKKVKELMPGGEEVDASVLLDMKIRPYYSGPAAGTEHLGLQGLSLLAKEIPNLGSKSLVFITPQNLNRVADFLDKRTWDANLRSLSAPFVKAKIPFKNFSLAMPEPRFLDHCHLDDQGNQELASLILQELEP